MPDSTSVKLMFGRIARRYDRANFLLSGGLDCGWRRELVAAVGQTGPREVLDLATGSGDVAFALSRKLSSATTITGMDFCQPMLDRAEAKKHAAGGREFRNVLFRPGDGLALPVDNDAYDAITIAFGLRNLADRDRGLREMHRALRPGGRLFVLEFSQPARWLRPFYYFYLRRILPLLAGLITGDRKAYVYLNETIASFPDRRGLAAEMSAAGFSDVIARPLSFGIVALHEARK
jgi:demethylmenaquinone methyltransferase / 2-methoxy-6-polyprenyl-1,4-benzoquinol methylase